MLLTIFSVFFLICLTGSAGIDNPDEVDDGCKMPWVNREDPNSLPTCNKCHDYVDPNTITSYVNANLVEGSVTATCMRGDRGKYDFPQATEGCHSNDPSNEEMFIGRSHPADVKPKDDMDIPEDLPVDENRNITCVSCHDPHKEYKSTQPWVSSSKEGSVISETEYRTYYLRRRDIASDMNSGSDLCLACHPEK